MSNQDFLPDQPTEANQVPYEGHAYGTARSSDIGSVHTHTQHESYVDPAGNQIESREEVYEDTNQRRAYIRYWIATVTYFVLGVLEIILLLRFIFRLLGANEGNSFIMFLYGLSHVFVAPFSGIFSNPVLSSNSVFEVSTLIAMLVYALLAWGIVSLGRVIFAPLPPGHQHITTTRRSRVS
jgi:hypothetical protein